MASLPQGEQQATARSSWLCTVHMSTHGHHQMTVDCSNHLVLPREASPLPMVYCCYFVFLPSLQLLNALHVLLNIGVEWAASCWRCSFMCRLSAAV